MRYLLFALAAISVGCQSVPHVQTPLLLEPKPLIVVRHGGGVQDGACPMWVKVDGSIKGEIMNGRFLSIDVEPGLRIVTLGRSQNGVFGAGTLCSGNLATAPLVTRSVEVGSKPVKLVYDMQGVGKRWIPIAGFFLAPTPVLNPEE